MSTINNPLFNINKLLMFAEGYHVKLFSKTLEIMSIKDKILFPFLWKVLRGMTEQDLISCIVS